MPIITEQPFSPARAHPRVDAAFMVKLFTNGRAVLAKAADLSMAGVRVLGDFVASADRVTVALPLPNDREVVTTGTVRRRSEDELAVEFDQLDWDDLLALARFLSPRL